MAIPVNIGQSDYNPTLYVDADTLGTTDISYFIVGNANQLRSGNWFPVNQFCSALSVLWLQMPTGPGQTYGFPDLSSGQQQSSAQTLMGFTSLKSQVDYAVTQLGGEQVTLGELNTALLTYGQGSQIWYGNDIHVCAAIVAADGSLLVYDSNNGQATEMTSAAFLVMLGNLGIDAIVVHVS